MLSRLVKLFLVATSLAPIFFTLWFISLSKSWNLCDGISYLVITISLSAICWGFLSLSKKRLEIIPVSIKSIKTADKELVGFVLIYLLPLIKSDLHVDSMTLIFVGVLFFFVVFTTNSYHFNPIIGFLGYHFYEVTIEGGVTYVLMSKRNISNCIDVNSVVQISEYMILEK